MVIRKTHYILGRRVISSLYSHKKPLEFTTVIKAHFGGGIVPKGTTVKFWEGVNFGYISFIDEAGNKRLLRE